MSIARYRAATTGKFTGTLKDADGTAISNANLLTMTLSLRDTETRAAVNSREAQDVLGGAGGTGANNVTVDSNGALTWSIQTGDTSLLTSNNSSEDHVATFIWTFTSGSETKTGSATHSLHCVDYVPFCSFDDVKQQLPAISDEDQDFVEMLIEGFVARAGTETGREFKKGTATEVYSVASGQLSIRVKRYPIVSIASIKQDQTGSFDSATAMSSDNYEFATMGGYGIIRLRNFGFDGGVGSVEIQYVGGLVQSMVGVDAASSVPWDLRMAAIRQVTYWYQRRSSLGVASESVSGMSVSLTVEQDLLPDVRAVLSQYSPTTLV